MLPYLLNYDSTVLNEQGIKNATVCISFEDGQNAAGLASPNPSLSVQKSR